MHWNLVIFISLVLLVVLVGTVSADTLIITAQNDGHVCEETDQTYFPMRNDVGDSVTNNQGSYIFIRILASTTTDIYSQNCRGLITINTSEINGGSVTSAKLSLDGANNQYALGTTNITIVDVSPASQTSFVAGDYDATTFTQLSNRIKTNDYSSGWNNLTLNAAGIASINTMGLTTFMLILSNDVDNKTYSWLSTGVTGFVFSSVGSATEPFMTIEYTPNIIAPVAAFTADHTSVCQQDPIQFTDQSTNAPTEWYWDFGDTSTNTTQNPVYRYSTNGLFTVKLQATNAFGFDWENKTNYIGVGDWGECVDQGESCQA